MKACVLIFMLLLAGCHSSRVVDVSSTIDTHKRDVYDSLAKVIVRYDTLVQVRYHTDSVKVIERLVIRDSVVLRVDANTGDVLGRDSWHNVENDRGIEQSSIDSSLVRERKEVTDSLVRYRFLVDSLSKATNTNVRDTVVKTRNIPGVVWLIVLSAGVLLGWLIWRK